MKSRSIKNIFALLLFSVLVVALPTPAKEPTNIEIAKQNLRRYHDSGAYERDIKKVMTQALNYLSWRLSQDNFKGKPAIVLDIDETSLSNYKSLADVNFSGTPNSLGTSPFTGDEPAIEPTLKLFQYAVSHHIPVFFITGRREKDRALTETNLKNKGFTPFKALFLRKDDDTASHAAYKTNLRKQLAEEGYDIILNVGDQNADFAGGYQDKTFKLPNPFYLVP